MYTVQDIVQLKIVRRLLDAGISLQRIRIALAFLANLTDEPVPLRELEVLSDGSRVLIRRSNEEFVDAIAGQYVLRFSLGDLLDEVQKPIELLSQAPMSTKKTNMKLSAVQIEHECQN